MGKYKHNKGYAYKVQSNQSCSICRQQKGDLPSIFSHWYYCDNCGRVFCPQHGPEWALCPECGGTIFESS